MVVSIQTLDVYWLIIELGMVAVILGRWPLFDQPEEPELQRPLTVFMVFPFSIYVLLFLIGDHDGLYLDLIYELITMMATLLLCLLIILDVMKRTEFHMNYRFVLGFATVSAISLASFFTILTASYHIITGNDVTNGTIMRSLVSVLVFGIVSGALFKRDMRRMDYSDLLDIDPEEEATV